MPTGTPSHIPKLASNNKKRHTHTNMSVAEVRVAQLLVFGSIYPGAIHSTSK